MNDEISIVEHFGQSLDHNGSLLWKSADCDKLVWTSRTHGGWHGHDVDSGHDRSGVVCKVFRKVKVKLTGPGDKM